jgi:hypothetical protein
VAKCSRSTPLLESTSCGNRPVRRAKFFNKLRRRLKRLQRIEAIDEGIDLLLERVAPASISAVDLHAEARSRRSKDSKLTGRLRRRPFPAGGRCLDGHSRSHYAARRVSKVRDLLAPLAAAWLVAYLLVMSGTVIIAFTAGGSHDIVCTCVHGDNHESCPMHGASKDSARCRLQSTNHGGDTALIALLAPLVLPTTSRMAPVDSPSSGPIGARSPAPSDWIIPPEPPPPRS